MRIKIWVPNFLTKKGNPNFRLNSTVSFDSSRLSHFDIVQALVGLIMASLHEVLTTASVQDTFVDKLIDDGWSIELFAMAAPNLEKFDDELRSMLGDLYDITTAVQRSALRLAWTRCQAMQVPAVPAPGPISICSVRGFSNSVYLVGNVSTKAHLRSGLCTEAEVQAQLSSRDFVA